jgi:hypothetical protein
MCKIVGLGSRSVDFAIFVNISGTDLLVCIATPNKSYASEDNSRTNKYNMETACH